MKTNLSEFYRLSAAYDTATPKFADYDRDNVDDIDHAAFHRKKKAAEREYAWRVYDAYAAATAWVEEFKRNNCAHCAYPSYDTGCTQVCARLEKESDIEEVLYHDIRLEQLLPDFPRVSDTHRDP